MSKEKEAIEAIIEWIVGDWSIEPDVIDDEYSHEDDGGYYMVSFSCEWIETNSVNIKVNSIYEDDLIFSDFEVECGEDSWYKLGLNDTVHFLMALLAKSKWD